jgi:hypothetical protein
LVVDLVDFVVVEAGDSVAVEVAVVLVLVAAVVDGEDMILVAS